MFAAVADGPADGTACWLTTDDGIRIRVAQWGIDGAKGTVLLFPGRTEYVEKYGRTAGDLARRGFATLVVDWRGQGLSDRFQPNAMLGDVGRFTDYQTDITAMLAHARARGMPEPYYLLAHSMGGCIGLRALSLGLPVRAVAFTSPMWGIQMAPALRPVAWTLSTISRPLRFDDRLAPGQSLDTYVLNAPFDGNTLTTDPDMWAYMKRQAQDHPTLALGGPTLRWLNESLVEMRYLSGIPTPTTPCLTYLGTDEHIVEPGPIRARMAKWPGGRLVTLQGARHEVLMEKPGTRAEVMDAIAAHFSESAALAA